MLLEELELLDEEELELPLAPMVPPLPLELEPEPELDEDALAVAVAPLDPLPALEPPDADAPLDALEDDEPVLPRLEPPVDAAPEPLPPSVDAPDDPALAPDDEPSVGAGHRLGSKPGLTQTFALQISSRRLQSAL